MNYNIQPGDTMLSIASNLTLSGAYATALMALPENDGQASSVTDDLTGRGVIFIPDNWLRAGVTQTAAGAIAAAGGQPLPQWLPLAFLAAIVLLG